MWSYLRIPDHITLTPATGFAILFPTTPHNREVSIKSFDQAAGRRVPRRPVKQSGVQAITGRLEPVGVVHLGIVQIQFQRCAVIGPCPDQ